MDATDHLRLLGLGSLPSLADREVQVIALHADGGRIQLERAYALLSPEERERAGRIRIDGTREEFVVGRAALRVLLGSALRVTPEAVVLEAGAAGKPFAPGVHSNLSHSHGWIYVAVCRSAAVGIDVEWVDPQIEAVEIARANFVAEETAQLAALPAGKDRALAFCTLWTRKEAVAKADGRGLLIPLAQVHVPGSRAGVAWIGDSSDAPMTPGSTEFHVQDLFAPAGFVASLAMEGSAYPVRFLVNSSLPLTFTV